MPAMDQLDLIESIDPSYQKLIYERLNNKMQQEGKQGVSEIVRVANVDRSTQFVCPQADPSYEKSIGEKKEENTARGQMRQVDNANRSTRFD